MDVSLIHNKILFIVTSALNSKVGVVNSTQRLQQTVETLINLKQKVPEATILLVDGSPDPVPEETKKIISQHCQCIWFGEHPEINSMSSIGRQSEAELLLLFNTFILFKRVPEFMSFLHGVKRIFKFSARSFLEDDFDINEYDNLFGKYVFKKSLPSWMPPERKKNITDHLYITRMYSFCPSLLDNYLQQIQPMLNNVMQHRIDFEHAHYLCLDKTHIVEFDRIKCSGIVSVSGQMERY